MPSATRTLTTNFIGKTDSLEKAFRRVNKGSALMSDKMRRNMRIGIGAIGGLGAAVGGFVALTKPMVDAASDIGESLSKNTVLFGASADRVAQWSETTARSFGISRREALEAVGVFGALTHAMGMSGAEGSDMSVTMVELAADMASFNNASPEETLIALQAGLRGEAEPLRRYGVLLDAATLKQRALSEGIITNTTKALTPQEKALAAYAEILAQTTVQQGDFERTSDGLANKQRILSSVWGDLQADLGEKLLPAFQAVTTFLVDEFMPGLEKVIEMDAEEFGEWFAGKMADGLGSYLRSQSSWDTIRDDLMVWVGVGKGLIQRIWDDDPFTLENLLGIPTGGAAPPALETPAESLALDVMAAVAAATAIGTSGGAGLDALEAAAGAEGMGVSADFAEAVADAITPGGPAGLGIFPGAGGGFDAPTSTGGFFEGGFPGGPAPTQLEQFEEAFGHLTPQQLEDFFGMAAGPSTRGVGLPGAIDPATRGGMVGTIIINAPLVTGDAVIGALHDAVENEGLTLPPRWSGSLGR